jgi:hypothetical protein
MDDRVEKRQTKLHNHLKDYILDQMSETSSNGVLNEHLVSEIHDKSKGHPQNSRQHIWSRNRCPSEDYNIEWDSV